MPHSSRFCDEWDQSKASAPPQREPGAFRPLKTAENPGRTRPPLRLQDGTLRPKSTAAPSDTERLIIVLNTLFDHAYDSALKDGETDTNAAQTALNAWRSSLPTIDSRASICKYVACVAAGAQGGWLRPEETKTLLYATQMALAALPRD